MQMILCQMLNSQQVIRNRTESWVLLPFSSHTFLAKAIYGHFCLLGNGPNAVMLSSLRFVEIFIEMETEKTAICDDTKETTNSIHLYVYYTK